MSHEEFDALAPVYAVGALDGEELARFQAHLRSGCPRCDAALRESEQVLTALARDLPPAIPPAYVRDDFLRRVAASPRRRPARAGWARWAAGAAAAIAAAALTAGLVSARYEARLEALARETSELRRELDAARATLRAERAEAQAVVALLRDPDTRVVALGGRGAASTARGRIVWNDKAGGRLYVHGLPRAPAGKTYELWTIAGRAPRPAGTFDVDASGAAAHPVPAAPGGPVRVFAVTLEPAGGVSSPTGPMVLASATSP
jgi:hypothetical protein